MTWLRNKWVCIFAIRGLNNLITNSSLKFLQQVATGIFHLTYLNFKSRCNCRNTFFSICTLYIIFKENYELRTNVSPLSMKQTRINILHTIKQF